MARLTINKNGQATLTIPKDVIEATGWRNGEILYVGKNKGENSVFIEKTEIQKEEKKKK
jgi:bifunctional DNA-binding transcriptional regulator/antitoxin component of YhaV-PrlF toxin-antitoxin module